MSHKQTNVDSPSYWQQTAKVHTLSTELPSDAQIVVVGGGWLGTASAYWAARAGASVVLLEREEFAAGATGRNGGFVGDGPDEPYQDAMRRLGPVAARTILDITRDNRIQMRQVLQDEAIECSYREPGHLHLALSKAQLSEYAESSAVLQQEGRSTFVLDREQVQKLINTALGPDILGGLFVPEMGLLHSVQLIQGLSEAAMRHGAHMVQATVQHLHAEEHQIRLETTGGTIRARGVIVAINAWSSSLLPQMKEVITPVRGQMLAYEALPPVFTSGITASFDGSEEYWQQTSEGVILLGGCRTAAPGHDLNILSNIPTEEVQHALEQVFPRLFPQLASSLRVKQRWAGPMAFTPDLAPVIDRITDFPNTWMVGAFSGHGMPYGLRVGQLLAQAVTEEISPPELFPFRLQRPTLSGWLTSER